METPDITTQVSALYEENPYPAHGVVSDVVARMLEPSIRELQRELGRQGLRVLDAGCGTGEQTLGIWCRFPECDVTGADLNQVSLNMAVALGERIHAPVRFVRRDLMLPLTDLGTFDVIVSVGVLHSLAKPDQGFRRLRELAERHTRFLGMVYGMFGKWSMFQIRDTLRLLCGSEMPRREQLEVLEASRLADNTGVLHYIEVLGKRMKFGPRIHPLEAVRRVLKGRNRSYQADSYTHVQEVVYTWAELAALLEGTGWTFVGWPEKSGMPDRPEQVLAGRAVELVKRKTLLERASIYERIVRPGNLFFLARA